MLKMYHRVNNWCNSHLAVLWLVMAVELEILVTIYSIKGHLWE